MKVALVCDWYYPRVGGLELHLQDLAGQLDRAGHQVVVVTPTPGAPDVDGIRVRRVDAPRAPVFGFLTTRGGIRAVGDALAAEGADVAHCHVSIVSPAALGGAFDANRRGIPAVVTFHSVIARTPTRLLARAAKLSLATPRWRVRFSAVSQRVARDVRAIAGPQPMTVLPNGIDTGFWRATLRAHDDVLDKSRNGSRSRPRGDDVRRLISVMRLNPKKRPLALVDMMRYLPNFLGEARRVHLRIVGDGPQRRRLERAISRHGLTDKIELLGYRSREQIRELLSMSDVFVLPALRESFGLAALEARCAGVPVVAMRDSGVAELIEHGREGLLAHSDTEFASHVALLAADAERRAAIAEYNRRTPPLFDWARTLDAHLALYRDAIALRANARVDTNT